MFKKPIKSKIVFEYKHTTPHQIILLLFYYKLVPTAKI